MEEDSRVDSKVDSKVDLPRLATLVVELVTCRGSASTLQSAS